MDRSWLAVVLAASLLGAGCLGLGGSDEDVETNDEDGAGNESGDTDPGSEDASEGASKARTNGTEQANGTEGPEPINRTHEDAGTVGVLLYDPGQSLGAKTTFAKRSYDNGLNGTWVLGYEVEPEPGHERITVETTAEPVDPLGEIPEYDLFVYGPGGEVVASSFEGGSEERATVDDPEDGTYLALLYYQEGVDNPIETHILVE